MSSAADAVIIIGVVAVALLVIFIIEKSDGQIRSRNTVKYGIDIIELGFICDGIIFDKLHK